MRIEYALKHWLLTLIISPFTAILLAILIGKDANEAFLSLYLIHFFWFFGFVFSLPGLAIYLGIFYLLQKLSVPVTDSKAILIIATIACIIFSFLFLETPALDLITAYSLTSAVAGLRLKLGKTENRATTGD